MWQHFKFLVSLSNVVCNGSEAGEPALDEWISRAELSDKLHEPVGLMSDSQIQNLVFFYLLPVVYLSIPTNWQVHIAMVGKYTGLSDSYLSVLKVHLVITS